MAPSAPKQISKPEMSIIEQQNDKTPSSDSDFNNIESMIAAMKKDVMECKQLMTKERHQSSDRNLTIN